MNEDNMKFISELCNIQIRSSDYIKKTEFVAPHEGAIIITPSCIVNNKLVFNDISYYSWDGYYSRPRDIIEIGDIILCKYAAAGSIYKSAVVDELPEPAITNANVFFLKKIKCDPHYFQIVISSPEFQKQLKKIQKKGSMPMITAKDFGDLKIPVPSINRQKKIVDFVIDYRKKHQELIDLLYKEIEEQNLVFDYHINTFLWGEA